MKGKNELGGRAESAVPPFTVCKHVHKQRRAHFNEVDIFTAGG